MFPKLMILAFVCHHNSLLIYGSLKTPTIDRFSTVTHYSTGASLILCLLMALSGFLTFGNLTKGNVLNNFPPQGHLVVQIARLCFGLNMLTTLPLECFVCREVMNNYWFPEEPYNPNRHLIFSSALVVSAMSISLITCDLGAVFELIGATSACALAYILPPLCYIKLSSRSWKFIPAIACIVFGSAVLIISLFLAMGKIIQSKSQYSLTKQILTPPRQGTRGPVLAAITVSAVRYKEYQIEMSSRCTASVPIEY
jgi:solute carrier family 38 (sodium-coupled neutral amino acid transporter), member 11